MRKGSDSVNIKPILFNIDMVRAILSGQKTVTRRVVKPAHGGILEVHDDPAGVSRMCEKCGAMCRGLRPPFEPGDILYVRETWGTRQAIQCLGITEKCPHKSCESANGPCFGREYIYKAEPTDHLPIGEKWHPSIHMPKEAARIFLRVTGVRVERLQDITSDGVRAEGTSGRFGATRGAFEMLWESTVKPADRALYGWAANPWVWVIEFERCEKPEVSS